MTPTDKSRAAKELTNNPLMQEILQEMETGLIGMAQEANLVDKEHCQVVIQGFQLLDQIASYIMQCIDEEKVEAFNLSLNREMH